MGTLVFAAAVVSFVGGTPEQAGTAVEPWIDTSNRDAVAIAYAEEFSRPTPEMAWTGDYDGCDPGSSSHELALATVRRVNYYRAMAGVPTGVTLNREYSTNAQHGALSMSATGRLSHTPDESFACLSETAILAAANSNLYLGRTGPSAIDGYIQDPGDRNRDVGHRNTILHPPTTEIGVGHVAGNEESYPANALWVFDDGVFDDNPPLREADGFVAWPPRGYVPAELVHPRWSFGLAGANFDNATVTMTTGGRTIDLTVVARLSQQGYVPAPILVWEPEAGSGSGDTASANGVTEDGAAAGEGTGNGAVLTAAVDDIDYDIVVAGVVVDGAEVSFSYTVTVLGSGDRDDRFDLPIDPVQLAFRATGEAVRDLTLLARSTAD
ncbi:MAG: CAP domain-containing protein [Actinomycetota bacterium]